LKVYPRYYTLAELPKQTGVEFPTLAAWAGQGYIKKALPVTYPGFKPEELHGPKETFYSEFEVERIRKAKAEADAIGSRTIVKFIFMSLYEAKPGHAISPKRLAKITKTGYELLNTAIENVTGITRTVRGSRLGIDGSAIPDIIAEVKRLRSEAERIKAEKCSATCKKRNETLKRIIGENAGAVKIHLKGMVIELQKADAEALAEEIINQL
jgi:hypothetical protein